MMGASFALPAHTWKKQIILTTKTIIMHTTPAMGTMKVQHSTSEIMPRSMVTISSLRA